MSILNNINASRLRDFTQTLWLLSIAAWVCNPSRPTVWVGNIYLGCMMSSIVTVPMAEGPAAKRAKRECSLCGKSYFKLTDHLVKAHKLVTKKEREPYVKIAFEKTPDLRVTSECICIKWLSLLLLLHSERLELEGAESSTPRKSYPCPFLHCTGKSTPGWRTTSAPLTN